MNPAKVMDMNRAQSIDIRCDIDSIEGSFRGELKNDQGISRSFSGWTEFATALMALARDTSNEATKNKDNEEN
jgi:hypothetical protein